MIEDITAPYLFYLINYAYHIAGLFGGINFWQIAVSKVVGKNLVNQLILAIRISFTV